MVRDFRLNGECDVSRDSEQKRCVVMERWVFICSHVCTVCTNNGICLSNALTWKCAAPAHLQSNEDQEYEKKVFIRRAATRHRNWEKGELVRSCMDGLWLKWDREHVHNSWRTTIGLELRPGVRFVKHRTISVLWISFSFSFGEFYETSFQTILPSSFFLVSYDGLALTSKGVSSGDFQIVKLAIKMRRNASVRGT